MIVYRAKFDRAKDGIGVTFPDIPEAITCGFSEPRAHTKGTRPIALPTLAEAKIRLYEAMRQAGVRKADLARRMGLQKSQVDRLLDLRHRSRLDQIEAALAKLHKRLVVNVEDLPRAAA
jgi:antitoxin component HigA of HigAB toxin-antitoxin module